MHKKKEKKKKCVHAIKPLHLCRMMQSSQSNLLSLAWRFYRAAEEDNTVAICNKSSAKVLRFRSELKNIK